MKIVVKNLQGKQNEYEVSENDTLENLKQKIATEFNSTIENIKLIYFGKVLTDNGKKLIDYGIKNADNLVMMLTKVFSNQTSPKNYIETT